MKMKFKDKNYHFKTAFCEKLINHVLLINNIICNINLVLFRNITMRLFFLHPYETGVEGHLHAME